MGRFLLPVLTLLIAVACNSTHTSAPIIYQGPIKELDSMETVYAEDDVVKLTVKAAKVFEFQSGDQEFPEGIQMEFYENGKKTSSIRSNKAYYFFEQKKWRAQVKVEVNNNKNNQYLRTEELFWTAENERIFTNKFVSIRSGDDFLYGKGLDAAQDLSDYTIKNPGGDFQLKD